MFNYVYLTNIKATKDHQYVYRLHLQPQRPMVGPNGECLCNADVFQTTTVSQTTPKTCTALLCDLPCDVPAGTTCKDYMLMYRPAIGTVRPSTICSCPDMYQTEVGLFSSVVTCVRRQQCKCSYNGKDYSVSQSHLLYYVFHN